MSNIARNIGPASGSRRAVRRYKRLYARLRRQEPEYRQRDNDRHWKKASPEKRERVRQSCIRWRALHPEQVARTFHAWHERVRARRCYYCGRKGKPGRYCGVRKVERMILNTKGELVKATVLWCGRC
jgi:hypothetical protein